MICRGPSCLHHRFEILDRLQEKGTTTDWGLDTEDLYLFSRESDSRDSVVLDRCGYVKSQVWLCSKRCGYVKDGVVML